MVNDIPDLYPPVRSELSEYERGVLEGYEKAAGSLLLISIHDPTTRHYCMNWILGQKKQQESFFKSQAIPNESRFQRLWEVYHQAFHALDDGEDHGDGTYTVPVSALLEAMNQLETEYPELEHDQFLENEHGVSDYIVVERFQ